MCRTACRVYSVQPSEPTRDSAKKRRDSLLKIPLPPPEPLNKNSVPLSTFCVTQGGPLMKRFAGLLLSLSVLLAMVGTGLAAAQEKSGRRTRKRKAHLCRR